MYIRLAKGYDEVISQSDSEFEIGKAILMRQPGEGLFITTGVMTQLAIQAVKKLEKIGIDCGIMHMHTIKPLDNDALNEWLPKVDGVVTVEEHTRIGGLGSAVLEYCSDEMPEHIRKIFRIGLPDNFADKYGSQNLLLDDFGITVESLCDAMQKQLKNS
jgi:transketolase